MQIGGPTGAFVVVVPGIIAQHGLDGLFMCTMMAGVLLVVMGLTGGGTAVRFIPRPVVIGFTNGIALVIASTQLRDSFGITLDAPAPGEFLERMTVLAENIGRASIIAALMFIRRVTATTTVSRVTEDYVRRGRSHTVQDTDIPGNVTILRIHGPFLFGATDKLTAHAAHIGDFAPIVVLRLRNMTALDGTGLRAIQDFADAVHATGRSLLLCGALPQPAMLMNAAEFHRHVGEDNILPNVEAALKRAAEIWETPGPRQPQQPPAA